MDVSIIEEDVTSTSKLKLKIPYLEAEEYNLLKKIIEKRGYSINQNIIQNSDNNILFINISWTGNALDDTKRSNLLNDIQLVLDKFKEIDNALNEVS